MIATKLRQIWPFLAHFGICNNGLSPMHRWVLPRLTYEIRTQSSFLMRELRIMKNPYEFSLYDDYNLLIICGRNIRHPIIMNVDTV